MHVTPNFALILLHISPKKQCTKRHCRKGTVALLDSTTLSSSSLTSSGASVTYSFATDTPTFSAFKHSPFFWAALSFFFTSVSTYEKSTRSTFTNPLGVLNLSRSPLMTRSDKDSSVVTRTVAASTVFFWLGDSLVIFFPVLTTKLWLHTTVKSGVTKSPFLNATVCGWTAESKSEPNWTTSLSTTHNRFNIVGKASISPPYVWTMPPYCPGMWIINDSRWYMALS